MQTKRPVQLALLSAFLTAGIAAGTAYARSASSASSALQPRAGEDELLGLEESIECAKRISGAFELLSQRVSPAVVSVTSHVRGFSGSWRQIAQGSGVVIRKDGVVATNNHVVDGGLEFIATFEDGTEVGAELIGRDPESDLAFLQLEGDNYIFAPLAQRDARVGEFTLAIGNPLGLGHTVTSGIISGLGRKDLGISGIAYEDFIQTNAEINPGNSGGPLIDLNGQVLGINTAIGVGDRGRGRGGYVHRGISYAIPSHMVNDVMRDVLEFGYVRRGFLGVETRDIDRASVARRTGVIPASQVRIVKVINDTPASRAGLLPDDVIFSLHGQTIGSTSELLKTIAQIPPETKVNLEIERNGARRALQVVLNQRPPARERR